MVKDKVIQMDNGKSYYVLEEIEYQGKKYILTLECDLEKDMVNEDDYFAMELAIENGELNIKKIDDNDIAKVVVGMLLSKMQNNGSLSNSGGK